jgi:cyclophilin family peptidyl-prolyl cis-trans isomerase
MAKKRQSSQSVRMRAKRRAEEARKKRNDQLRFAALAVVTVVVLGAAVFLVTRLRSSDSAAAGSEVDFGDPGPLAAIAPADRNNNYSEPPAMTIDTNKNYEAVIRTEKGDMRLQLYAKDSPLTVNNFIFLARQGYYDGTVFHRVIAGFMAQGGDPTGTGSGGPGYAFADELDNGLTFDQAGVLAMANRGPNTNGSQFFITFVPRPDLNGGYTIFGELTEGQDVLNSLTKVDPQNPTGVTGDKIERIAIIES